MLRQYLVTAQEDLTSKKELVNIKQARLSLAQDEYSHLNTTLSALSASTTSCKYSNTSSSQQFNDHDNQMPTMMTTPMLWVEVVVNILLNILLTCMNLININILLPLCLCILQCFFHDQIKVVSLTKCVILF